MAWWKLWDRRRISLKDGDFWAQYLGDSDWAGETVTVEGAQKLSVWWRARQLYADVAGTCSLKFYERKGDERIRNTDHDVARIIASEPNFDNTAKEFWSAQAIALCTDGNGYAEIVRGPRDRMISLELLPPGTYPFRTEADVLRYRYYDRGKVYELPREKVFHTRSYYAGGDLGMSPLAAARRSLATSIATERAVAQTFGRGMRAKGFFTVPQLLTEEQRKQTKKVLIDPFTGPNGADWGVLEAGFDVKTVNIAPKDAELLLNRRHNIEDVCRWLGIPPILVGHSADGQTMWGSGVESIILAWRTLGLDSFLADIETSINKRLLSAPDRRRFFAEFDRDSLMQADSTARAAILNAMIQNAQLTPNEGRRLQNRPSMDGGDELLINSTLIPLASAGKKATADPAAQPQAQADGPLKVPNFQDKDE